MTEHLKLTFSKPVLWRDFKRNNTFPVAEGVYKFTYIGSGRPTFLAQGTGGLFKGNDPNIDVSRLGDKWIDDESVVYIGKAKNLCKREGQRIEFSEGKDIGAWGGRYLWQIQDAENLLQVAYAVCDDSENVEHSLLCQFADSHEGRLPFANLKK